MRSFVVLGQTALASDDFALDDLPSTSGRIDVLLRCVRAAVLFSHGIRHDVVVYLVLGGGGRAPRVLRLRGADAKFVRPDERSLATLVKKVLATRVDGYTSGFVDVRPGIAIASGGLKLVLLDVEGSAMYVLEEGASDLRDEPPWLGDASFFLGDHRGFDRSTRAELARAGARPISVGPVSLHTEDAIAIVSNEIDRRAARLVNG
jgi:tRNA (pseudouridine54-N1)-methyltransferase